MGVSLVTVNKNADHLGICTWLERVQPSGVFILMHRSLAQDNKLVYLILIFPLIGIFILWSAFTGLQRWKRFGRSHFEMATVPGVIGGDLGGSLIRVLTFDPRADFNFI